MKAGCEIIVTVKPGMPAGPIEQKVRLQTNLPDMPDAEIKINGRIGSPDPGPWGANGTRSGARFVWGRSTAPSGLGDN